MNIPTSNLIKNTWSYAFAEVDKMVSSLKEKWIDVIDFWVWDPTSPTPEFIRNSCKDGLDKHKSSGYPSNVWSKDYKIECAKYMKRRFSVDLDPDTEIMSNIWSKESIFNFPLWFINPWDIVIIPTPWYPPMTTWTKFAHGKPFYVWLFEENDFLIDYESIPEDIASKAVIIWINYPNSPTWKAANLDYYKWLITWAKKYNIIIAADEWCYIDIYFNNNPPHSILELEKEWVIAFYSLSKRNNMTWYRAWFVCWDKDIITNFSKVKTNIDSWTPSFVQEAAITALNDDNHIEQMRQEYFEKQQILLNTLNSIWLETKAPDATFYVWQKAPNWMNWIEFAKKFLSDDIWVVVTPWAWISQEDSTNWKNPWDNYVRFALVSTIDQVKKACERIKNNY